MPASPEIPNGFVFFSETASPRRRRRRTLFVALVLIAAAALVWPVYPLAGSIFPLVLGLPLSLAWVVLWLVIVFGALIWLYRSDEQDRGPQTTDGRPSRTGG